MRKSKNYAFVDGSFNPFTKVYGCGGFLIDQKGWKHVIQGCGNDPDLAKMRNVAGEILGAELVIRKALELGMKKLTIYYDYKGIASWPTGEWKCKKTATKNYRQLVIDAMSIGLKIFFVYAKAHSGIPGNEEADRLAKEAVGILTTKQLRRAA